MPGDIADIIKALQQTPLKVMTREIKLHNRYFAEQIHCAPAFQTFRIYIQDITKLKHTEKALSESEAKYRKIFHNANDLLLINEVNEKGIIGPVIEVNARACSSLGYTQAELFRLSSLDLIAPEALAAFTRLRKVLLKQGNVSFESILISKDGVTLPVEINAHLFELKDKQVVLSIARDITSRKQQEEKLKHNFEVAPG